MSLILSGQNNNRIVFVSSTLTFEHIFTIFSLSFQFVNVDGEVAFTDQFGREVEVVNAAGQDPFELAERQQEQAQIRARIQAQQALLRTLQGNLAGTGAQAGQQNQGFNNLGNLAGLLGIEAFEDIGELAELGSIGNLNQNANAGGFFVQ